MKKSVRSFVRKSLCGASALAIAGSMMTLPAFADAGDSEMSTDTSNYVTCSAYAAAEPAPEILGLTNMGWRPMDGTIGQLSWSNPSFNIWGTSINSNPNPFYWNSVIRYASANNGDATTEDGKTVSPNDPLTVVAGYTRAGRGPNGAMNTYANADSVEKSIWNLEPDIILGMQSGAKNVDYSGAEYQGAVREATGDSNYSPVGINFSMTTNANILDSMYDLAAAGDKVAKDNPNKKLRYGNATNIAKEMEAYYRGSQGYVLKRLAQDHKSQKTFVVISGYDSATDTWTAVKTGSVNGQTSTNRTVEALQYVAKNLADSDKSDNENVSMTTAQLEKADSILIGSVIASGSTEDGLVTALQSKGLQDKAYWDGQGKGTSSHPGSVFGTTHNSPENIQNYGRILGFVYPEYIDQDDMICYYYDHFYHIRNGETLANTIASAMDGVRNYDAKGTDLTDWTTADAATYNSGDVEDILKEGLAYIQSHESDLAKDLRVSKNYGTVSTNTISGAKVTLSSSKTYTGKAIKPKVTVSLGGKTLPSSNYKVSYANNKNVGRATVTVRGTGSYYGHVAKTFKINPKGTSLTKATPAKKAFKATWKKQSTQTTGYQVRYSTKSSMKGAKTKTVKKAGTTKLTVKSLKAGEKYYVQVRTYKKASGANYYSAWSGKKSVKTK